MGEPADEGEEDTSGEFGAESIATMRGDEGAELETGLA